ncbi:MAG: hypothetical protein E6J71_15690 [Deltaproteobacteria bacterium]|nr:MAG: hypothetical protein E6J71_15690 [Deltaproteobacteria bacterium]
MRSAWAATIVGMAGLAVAAESPALLERETPRATDLLRAKRMAERVERRLRAPASHGSAWRQGGSGWDTTPESPPESKNLTIRVSPPRRRPHLE